MVEYMEGCLVAMAEELHSVETQEAMEVETGSHHNLENCVKHRSLKLRKVRNSLFNCYLILIHFK